MAIKIQRDPSTPLPQHLPKPGMLSRFTRELSRMPGLVLASALFLMGTFVLFVGADVLAPQHYAEQDLLARLAPPIFMGGTSAHWLGTDELGRDLLSRLIYATRMSIFVAIAGTAIGAMIGTTLGFVAAHFRGWVEEVIMMLVDFQASIPFLIVALAVLAFFGNNFVLFVVVMGLNGWETYARLTRGMVLSMESRGYVVAIRTLGARPLRVYGRHVLPNIASALIVQFTLNFPETILLETSMSFLGLGVQPPLTSLGLMLGAGRDYLITAWWIAVAPGVMIFLTTLSVSILGDWLRDRLDPTLKR
jgi:peptide/nickel transport system permease protein